MRLASPRWHDAQTDLKVLLMLAVTGLLDALDQSIARKSVHQRVEALRSLTDLFATGAANFSEDQIELFDEVMSRLVKEVDQSCRAAFDSQRRSTGKT
jgi:hypothetical protein